MHNEVKSLFWGLKNLNKKSKKAPRDPSGSVGAFLGFGESQIRDEKPFKLNKNFGRGEKI